ncbi:DUF7426 family protein [Brachybacterium kimchii]|uniref:DUF7426 domain-containing protein n=1 Tax=Brachybacterium kimchii TaxID=2942909 RepID=A0ABY4N7T3_9MICO|nr:hypothetical protein [Brachybacterium kimchii]UQN29483.1 hypothetical protein M4486_17890 [Brachybacterium kimchii]
MSAFKDLDQFLDDSLVLPINGKDYRIPAVSAQLGLKLQRILEVTEDAQNNRASDEDVQELISDAEELELYPDVLGDAYDEMLSDGISYPRLRLAAITAILWNVHGEDMAAEFWAAGGKAPEPNRAQRRAPKTRTGGASTTKRPASGSGTSTRRKPSGSARKAAG